MVRYGSNCYNKWSNCRKNQPRACCVFTLRAPSIQPHSLNPSSSDLFWVLAVIISCESDATQNQIPAQWKKLDSCFWKWTQFARKVCIHPTNHKLSQSWAMNDTRLTIFEKLGLQTKIFLLCSTSTFMMPWLHCIRLESCSMVPTCKLSVVTSFLLF